MWTATAYSGYDWNYGYGELFRGGVTTKRNVYWFQPVDLGGLAQSGDQRRIQLFAPANSDPSSPELFYAAMAPDGETGLAALLDNRIPLTVAEPSDKAPAVAMVAADDVAASSALLSMTVDRPGRGQLTAYVRWRPETGTSWITKPVLVSQGMGSATVQGLARSTRYEAQASLDQSFSEDSRVSAAFSTRAHELTLSTLIVEDNGQRSALKPALGPDTAAYGANVASSATHATLTTATHDPAATVAWLDANDAEIEDADTNAPGFQVALGPPRSTTGFKAWVGAADTSATRTYTLAITRELDRTPPLMQSVTLNGAIVTVLYDEDLDESSTPDGSDFKVRILDFRTRGRSDVEVTEVTVVGNEVVLMLGQPARWGDDVRLTYTPGAGRIRDVDGNEAVREVRTADNITGPSGDSSLSSLSLSSITLSPPFNPEITKYTGVVPRHVTSTAVEPVATDERAFVFYHTQRQLALGKNTIKLDVSAENGVILRYIVTVTRSEDDTPPVLETASADRDLLVLTYGELLRESKPDGTDFSVSVTDSATVTVSSWTVTGVSIEGQMVHLVVCHYCIDG